MNLTWKSQRFEAEGSTTAPGILRQLGRPSLDEFAILVREAAQNSWDARRGDTDVDFSIRLERLGDHGAAWRSHLLPGPSSESVPGFSHALADDAWCVVVTDRGTQGLGGPTRATTRPAVGERNDFVQFMRNVGEARDKELGGGTYGFGKGVFYRTSRVRTILSDSRIAIDGGYERRLMGAALGNDYWDTSDTRYTGRHWWGTVVDGVVDPVTGMDAMSISRDLGLPAFGEDETGTNIVILGADLSLFAEDDQLADAEAVGIHLASAILWNLWPKFRSVSASPPVAMDFSVTVEGHTIAIPSPDHVLALRPFVESFRGLGGPDTTPYRRTGQPRHPGDLAVRTVVAADDEAPVVQSAKPFGESPHHVARMRQAGLVVDYFAGPSHPDPGFAYGGVFMATAEVDHIFSDAEPPTHDRWNPEGLERNERRVVDGAKRFLYQELNRRFPAAAGDGRASSGTGLGHGSRRLSGLVAGVGSTGPDPMFGPPGGDGGGRRRRGARLIGDPWIAAYNESLHVLANVKIDDPEGVASVEAFLDVVVDGGRREDSAPLGASEPHILGWMAAEKRNLWQDGPVLSAIAGVTDWIVVAEFSDTAVMRFRLEVKERIDGA